MLAKLAGENHRLLEILFLGGSLLLLSLLLILPAGAQRPYSYEGYLRTIARFRTDVAHIDDPLNCVETVDAIADELEQITLIEMPDRTLMTVEHQGVADALRQRPCSRTKADRYLSGLYPERMCPASRPVPPVQSLEGGSSNGSGGSLVGIGGGSGEGEAPPPGPDDGPSLPTPGGGQPASGPGGDNGDLNDGDNGVPGDNEGGQEGLGEPEAVATGLPVGSGNGEGRTNEPALTPSPTPTPTPTPEPAAATEEEEKEGISPWIFVIIGVALVFIILAVALLFWPSVEEEKEQKRKRKLAGAAMSEGRKLVEEGDYREAVRRLFLATLLTLDEKGILRYDTTQTNYELLEQEWIRPSLVPALAPVIGAYERVWYGLQPLPAGEYDLLVKKIKQIQDWQGTTNMPSPSSPQSRSSDGIS